MCMTFKLMIAFFLAMLSCFSSTAGRNYVPSEIQTEIDAGVEVSPICILSLRVTLLKE